MGRGEERCEGGEGRCEVGEERWERGRGGGEMEREVGRGWLFREICSSSVYCTPAELGCSKYD